MTRDDYLVLLRRALSTPHGVALQFGDFYEAEQARGRLYRLRSTHRQAGDTSFDNLSLVLRPYGGLWIVRRDRLPRHNREDGLSGESRLIDREEQPDHFGYSNYVLAVSKPKRR